MGIMRIIIEWAFYCSANGETFDGYDSFQEAFDGIQRLIDSGNFDEDDFESPYPIFGDA